MRGREERAKSREGRAFRHQEVKGQTERQMGAERALRCCCSPSLLRKWLRALPLRGKVGKQRNPRLCGLSSLPK